ncbi:Uncharacterized protein TCM_032909 [Theobroma cacao]|uniref:Uncharacterized protein n=1 Tax=Theobroma cacao TaxID=3641 RepID=A0A061FHL4_THECC|nr:Uncharacterized protein TCM_032909 [Theobroma cacao]
MLINEIVDYFTANTHCDQPKTHAVFNPMDKHTIKKLGFEFKNSTWVRKRTINLLVFDNEVHEGNEGNEGELRTYPSGPSSAYPNAPMSTTFDVEHAFTRLFSYMETMDSRLTTGMDVWRYKIMRYCNANKAWRMSSILDFHHYNEFSWETFFTSILDCSIGWLHVHLFFMHHVVLLALRQSRTMNINR